MATSLCRNTTMKAAPSTAGRPARSRTVSVSASAKQQPISKAAGAAALSAAILLGQGTLSVPPSTAAPMEHAIFVGGLRGAVNQIKNVGKQGITEPREVPVPNSDTPTQTKTSIPIPTMPDLLKAVADPNTAPGEGPLNTLAKEEKMSEGNLNAPPNEAGDAGSTDPAMRNQTRNSLFSSSGTGSLKSVISDAKDSATQRLASAGNIGSSNPLSLGQGFPDAAADIKQGAATTGGDNKQTTTFANALVDSATSIANSANRTAEKAGRIASDTPNMDKIQNVTDKLDIKGAANAVSRPLGNLVDSTVDKVQSVVSSSAQNNAQSNNGLLGGASPVVERAGQAARDLVRGTPVPEASNNAQTAVGNAKRSILGGSASLPADLQRGANKAADNAKDAARQVSAKAGDAKDSLSGSLKDATRGAKSAGDDISGSLKTGARQTNVSASSAGDRASSAVSNAKGRASDAAADAKRGLKGAVRDLKDALPGNN